MVRGHRPLLLRLCANIYRRNLEDLDNQEYEHDKWLGRKHPAGIRFIYDKHTIYESDCSDYEKEIHETYYQKYLQKNKSREGD